MIPRHFALWCCAVLALAVTPSAQTPVPSRPKPSAAPIGQVPKAYAPAKTPWGDPDLQGTYTNKDESGIPFERPGQFAGKSNADVDDDELKELIAERSKAAVERAPGIGGAETGAGPTHWYENYGAKNSRAWLVVDPADGAIPATTAEANARNAERARSRASHGPADSPEDRSLYDRCITRGLPGSMMPAIYGNSYEIVQSPGWVAIRYEMVHETRLIPLDARPHVRSGVRTYMGDARGHFEGSTLVVETTNFKAASAYRGASEQLKLIERFKPVGPRTVEWSVTADDSHTWPRPWTFAMNLTKDSSQAIFEYACHEGNYGLRDILSAERAAEKGHAD
ncbi:MAG TPA: hypothetical protein VLV86_09975 [Vicinamibacterales bacterium]|nr:hypothetical protein [Vicinamibacterales bacterium]